MRPILLAVIPLLASWLLRAWFATCRKREHGRKYLEEILDYNEPIVATTWHYGVPGMVMFGKVIPMAVMVSSSEDGDFVARLFEHVGFVVVRGSSNRRGLSAAKELIRDMKGGLNCGLICDGSQGPARVAQSGPLLLAAKAGRLVFPFVWSASRYSALNTWDRLVLPKPFATIDIIYGEPIHLPEGLKAHDLEEHRLVLEQHLNELYKRAWKLHGKEEH